MIGAGCRSSQKIVEIRATDGDRAQPDDEGRIEPVVLLPLVEHQLQRGQADATAAPSPMKSMRNGWPFRAARWAFR